MSPEEAITYLHKTRNMKAIYRLSLERKFVEDIVNFTQRTDYPFPEYSSWFLTHLAKDHPKRVFKFTEKIIDVWLESDNHAIHRNLLKTVTHIPFTNYRDGEMLDRILWFLNDSDTKVAVKLFCFNYLENFMEEFPELFHEVEQIINNHFENSTSAFKGRSQKFLKKYGSK